GTVTGVQTCALPISALAVMLAIGVARPLNVLAAGELRARTVGLGLEAWRTLLFIACAILTAIAVVSAGTVDLWGFITRTPGRLSSAAGNPASLRPARRWPAGRCWPPRIWWREPSR